MSDDPASRKPIKTITPVWLITVAAAIPSNPIPSHIPGMPNIISGFSPILAKKAPMSAYCIETVSPRACNSPFNPYPMVKPGRLKSRMVK